MRLVRLELIHPRLTVHRLACTAPRLWQAYGRTRRGGFFHDGRFASLLEVVNHYDTQFNLGLSDRQKNDLVEYLKGI